jgi:hypothetical protein
MSDDTDTDDEAAADRVDQAMFEQAFQTMLREGLLLTSDQMQERTQEVYEKCRCVCVAVRDNCLFDVKAAVMVSTQFQHGTAVG